MDSRHYYIKETARIELSYLSAQEIETKLLIIGYVLGDYEFLNDPEETGIITPGDVLDAYLDTFFNLNEDQKAYSEWFFLLALFFISQIDDDNLDTARILDFADNAVTIARIYSKYAIRLEEGIKSEKEKRNSDRNISLNKNKYAPNRLLKELAFKEYAFAYAELQAKDQRFKYEDIAEVVWPRIKGRNFNPNNGDKIIGRNGKDPITTLLKWFAEGASQGKLRSTRLQ